MIERFAARFGGVDEDAEVLARALLADEFVECPGPKRRIGILGGAFGRGQAGGVGGAHALPPPRPARDELEGTKVAKVTKVVETATKSPGLAVGRGGIAG